MDADRPDESRKRLRTAHACDICRSRKIRCDGLDPCTSCASSNQACTYGSEANSRGKSDLILESVLRVEKFLYEMNASIATAPSILRPTAWNQDSAVSRLAASNLHLQTLLQSPAPKDALPRPPPTPMTDGARTDGAGIENAVLDSMHTSTTESVLQWPHFDTFPSLREQYVSVFQLEQSRRPVKMRTSTMYPYVTAEDIDDILAAFERHINFCYPTMSRLQLDRSRAILTGGLAEEDSDTAALALLTVALGCASQTVAGLSTGAPVSEEELHWRASRRAMGDIYLDNVLKKLHVVHMSVNATATHCLFLIALYFAFLRRPLQAWEYINAASAKCLLLMSYPPEDESAEDRERIRRIFWSCYILESDYLAELSALPLSGIAHIESSVALPGAYHTDTDQAREEESSLYFLACISMRRLLNRVHQLLYACGTGASLDSARFPYIVAELNRQLEEWRDVLPAAFAFTVDLEPTATETGGFLRQRYLTCRSVLYRPYLMWMLSGKGDLSAADDGRGGTDMVAPAPRQDVLANCKNCIEACLLHILNLRGFSQTVLIDTWICSLSMAAAMLVLLAACRMPSLRILIPSDVLRAGHHLTHILAQWQNIAGGPSSPSVDQSIRIIQEADVFIKQVYGPRTSMDPSLESVGKVQ